MKKVRFTVLAFYFTIVSCVKMNLEVQMEEFQSLPEEEFQSPQEPFATKKEDPTSRPSSGLGSVSTADPNDEIVNPGDVQNLIQDENELDDIMAEVRETGVLPYEILRNMGIAYDASDSKKIAALRSYLSNISEIQRMLLSNPSCVRKIASLTKKSNDIISITCDDRHLEFQKEKWEKILVLIEAELLSRFKQAVANLRSVVTISSHSIDDYLKKWKEQQGIVYAMLRKPHEYRRGNLTETFEEIFFDALEYSYVAVLNHLASQSEWRKELENRWKEVGVWQQTLKMIFQSESMKEKAANFQLQIFNKITEKRA